jgi:spore coat polysaccharide biosynthesis protein SpsF (cytidylyltransferase family)
MIGIFITARLGSTRLPAKHLVHAAGRTYMEWLYGRMLHEFREEVGTGNVMIAIATSEKGENKRFLEIVNGNPVTVFFGADESIPLRHLQCAEKYGCTHVISVDGDDILCSPAAARAVYTAMRGGTAADVFTVEGLPLGMNLSGYTTAYLKRSVEAATQEKYETGWGRIFNNPVVHLISLGEYDIMGDLRFTLDYEDDAAFFKTVIESLGEKTLTISDEELIRHVQEQGMEKINAHLKKTYWTNYNSEKEKESNKT